MAFRTSQSEDSNRFESSRGGESVATPAPEAEAVPVLGMHEEEPATEEVKAGHAWHALPAVEY